MAFQIECKDPGYIRAKGLTEVPNGEYIKEAFVFTGTMPPGTIYEGFRPEHYSGVEPGYVVFGRITAAENGILIQNLVKEKGEIKPGLFSFGIDNDFLASAGLPVAIVHEGDKYRGILRVARPITEVKSKYKPWQTRGFDF